MQQAEPDELRVDCKASASVSVLQPEDGQ